MCTKGGLVLTPAVATDIVVMAIPGLVTVGTPQRLKKVSLSRSDKVRDGLSCCDHSHSDLCSFVAG